MFNGKETCDLSWKWFRLSGFTCVKVKNMNLKHLTVTDTSNGLHCTRDPAESPSKGLNISSPFKGYSPPSLKSSKEMAVSTRGKIESDKSVLNSARRVLIHINGDRNICKWIHKQKGLNITLHRRGGIITPIVAWDSAISDSSSCTLPANTKPLSLRWASLESLQFLASLEPELSLLPAQRTRGGLVESTKPPSPLDGHISRR